MTTNQSIPLVKSIQAIKSPYRRPGFMVLLLALAAGFWGCQGTVVPTATEKIAVTNSPTPVLATETPTSTPRPSSTPTPVPSPTFDITTVEDWAAGRLIFDLVEHNFGEKDFRGIFELDLETNTLTEISNAGTKLLDISPDHQRILTADEQVLAIIDLNSGASQKLTENYYHLSPSGAKWDHGTNQIYYLAADASDIFLIQINPDSGETAQFPINSTIAVLAADLGTIIIGKGTCNTFGSYTYAQLQWINDQGDELASVELGDAILLPCQRPNAFVYSPKDPEGSLSLHIRPHGQDAETVFWAFATEYADCAWSPDGNRLAVTVINRGWYSGSILDYYFQLLIPATNEIIDLSYLNAPLDHVIWSPDGRYTAFRGTTLNDETYQVEINVAQIYPFSVRRFDQLDQLQSANYLAIPNMLWAP